MRVQSHDGAIHILPALPDVWTDGNVKGLVTRGGFVVDVDWNNSKVNAVKVTSRLGGNCRIRVYHELKGNGSTRLKKAKGTNLSPFFEIARIRQPLGSNNAKQFG